jgi:hypothetical protein
MQRNRRDFLKTAALASAGAALHGTFAKRRAWAFAQSPTKIRSSLLLCPA